MHFAPELFEITLELGCYKYPPHNQLRQYWKDNQEALLAFIERVHMGIKGFVLDKNTGEPITVTPASGTNATVIDVDEIGHPVVATACASSFACCNLEALVANPSPVPSQRASQL